MSLKRNKHLRKALELTCKVLEKLKIEHNPEYYLSLATQDKENHAVLNINTDTTKSNDITQ